MREHRLGDIIDDYCIKCKRIMNHAIVSMLNGEPAKVRCRTCHNDHDYRHEQAPPPKVDARKAALFNEVLAKVAPPAPSADADEDSPDDDLAEESMADEELAEEAVSEEAEPEEAVAESPAPKKAAAKKAASKGKAAPKSKKAKGSK